MLKELLAISEAPAKTFTDLQKWKDAAKKNGLKVHYETRWKSGEGHGHYEARGKNGIGFYNLGTSMGKTYDTGRLTIHASHDINEAVTPLPSDMSLEDTLVALHKRMAAVCHAFGLVNKLKDKEQRKKHFSAITANMNTIRAGLDRAIKELNSFEKASSSYERGEMHASMHEEANDTYWLVKNTRTGVVHSVLTDEDKAWNLADRMELVGRKDHYIVIAGSKADYDKFRAKKG